MNELIGKKIYVTQIEHKYGVTVLVNASAVGAYKALHDWVIENWNRSTEIPADRQSAVEQYFDAFSGESYYMDEVLVEP